MAAPKTTETIDRSIDMDAQVAVADYRLG